MSSPWKTQLVQNESLCENELIKPVGGSLKNGFALRLILTQRQKAIRKWPIGLM